MADDESDPNLIARAIAGERVALEELLLLHYDRLATRLGGKIPAELRGKISAEDVLQEAFGESVQHIGQFRGDNEDAFFHWLAKIADNRLIDMVRAQRAVKRGGGRAAANAGVGADDESIGDLLAVLAVHERTPSRSAAGHEAVSAVTAAIEALSEAYREAIRLRYLEGLAVAEVAKRMGRTEASVHMLLHRGLQRLRATLGSVSKFMSRKA